MVEFIDIPNENGDITDFDFKVNGKVYHAGIDSSFEFGSEGIAPGAGCGYDNAADYADNLDKYISRANSDYFEVSDDDWSAIVDHFRDLVQANEDKYSDTWEDFGDDDWDEEDYDGDDLTESAAKKAPLTEAVELSGSKAAVDVAFPDVPDNVKSIITGWYDYEFAYEDFTDVNEFAAYIRDDIVNMLDAADYPERDIVGMTLAKRGYAPKVYGPKFFPNNEPYPYYDELAKYGLTESYSRRNSLREAVKKASLNNLVAEILKSDPPKPIKRPGDAVKWFKDLAKDKEFVKEQTNKFIDGKKLDKAIDFLENINYLLTIGESEATKLVKKYAKDEKKFPLIKA